MNFVYISPNFPDAAWKFANALHQNGVTVLGIGDQHYHELKPQLKAALTEYFKVSNLENYDEVYRATAYFAWKYGRIDWIESNNEYWLEQDARLRTDFNVNTGIKLDGIHAIKEKSEMKKYYALGGIRTARQIKSNEGIEAVKKFAKDAGYPLFAKPDVGVGAVGTFKIVDDDDLEAFFNEAEHADKYVIEEFVTGNICDYDAIIDSKGHPLFESWSICPPINCRHRREESRFYLSCGEGHEREPAFLGPSNYQGFRGEEPLCASRVLPPRPCPPRPWQPRRFRGA